MRVWKLDSYTLAKTIVKGVQLVLNYQEQSLDIFNYIAFPYAKDAFLAVQQKQKKEIEIWYKVAVEEHSIFSSFPCLPMIFFQIKDNMLSPERRVISNYLFSPHLYKNLIVLSEFKHVDLGFT